MVPLKPTATEQVEIDLCQMERLAREYGGSAEVSGREFDATWVSVEIGKRGKVYYAVNGRRYPREAAVALLADRKKPPDAAP